MPVVVGLLIAYFFTGLEMVSIAIDGSPMDRPAFVHGSFQQKVVAGAIWPIVCRINNDLGWFICTYVADLLVTIAYLALMIHNLALAWAIVIVVLFRFVPVLNLLFKFPCSIIFAVLWAVLSKSFGYETPSHIQRYTKEQELRKRQRDLAKLFKRR